ncbi:MAG: hypothetical protein WCO52_02830 [bacterium]
MPRKRLLAILVSLYLVFGVGIVGMAAKVWASSSPTLHISVLGASSDSTVLADVSAAPILASYPTLDATLLPRILSKEYSLYDVDSGRTLVSSQMLDPVPIASTTKMMTIHLATRYLIPSDTQTVSLAAAKQPPESSLMGIHNGERITVEQLMYGAMMVSGNDAAYALAEQSGGVLLNNQSASSSEKIARFVVEMNDEAKALGMSSTKYVEPVGINDEVRSNAVDLAKLASIWVRDPEVVKIIGTPTISFNSDSGYHYDMKDSNRLVADYQYQGIIGGKTGYTDAAGHCLVNVATRNGHTLVAVILHTNSQTNEASALESRKLLDAGFSLTHWN